MSSRALNYLWDYFICGKFLLRSGNCSMAKTLRVLQNKGKTQIFLDGKEITGVERYDVYRTKNDTKAKIRLVVRIDSDVILDYRKS